MALVVFDRVQESTTTAGTGPVTLGGAVAGFQTFAVVGNGNTTYYCIVDTIVGAWEVGIGTYSTTGPTLSRTTILSNSNGDTSPITLSSSSNTKSVFVTYPAEKSVNLDASGNVTPLGNVASATWQANTVAVAYGGTGVTASSGANSVVLRDANQNIVANKISQSVNNITASGGTTALTVSSAFWQTLQGTGAHTITLPDATTLPIGFWYIFDNDSTGNLTVKDYGGTTLDVVSPGGYSLFYLDDISSVAGSWNRAGLIPAEVNWGTNSLDLGGSTVITNGVWQGTPVGTAYGGTGLTGFSAANYALYSTSASVLTAGTLPVAAGGTSVTSFTANGVVYGNGTNPLQVTAAGITGQVLVGNTGAAPSWSNVASALVSSFSAGTTGLTPNTATTGAVTLAGTLNVTNGGTGLTAVTATYIPYGSTANALATTSSFTYNAATGTETAPVQAASNGLILNSNTVSTSYSVTAGYNAMSVGPVAVASGASVTIPSGNRWVVL